MKKHLLKKVLLGIGIATLASTGIVNNSKTVFAEEKIIENEFFQLDTENVNELWIGDEVSSSKWIGNEKIYTVIEGDSVKINENKWGMKNIKAVKEGYSKVKIQYYEKNNGEKELLLEETYEINVVKRKNIEFVGIPESLKIGEKINYTILNGNYGSIPGIYIAEPNNSFEMPGYGGSTDVRNWSGNIFTSVKYDCNGNEYKGTVNNVATIALYPGEYSYGMYENLDYDSIKNGTLKPVGTGTLIIEEPEIKTNMPETVKPGTSIDFETELSNLYMENEDVVKLLKNIYHPEISIIDGEDCIKCSDKKYEELSSIEKVEFIKEGIVTLNIKYVATMPDEEVENNFYYDNQIPKLYTAEKTISIKVTNEIETSNNESNKNETELNSESNDNSNMQTENDS